MIQYQLKYTIKIYIKIKTYSKSLKNFRWSKFISTLHTYKISRIKLYSLTHFLYKNRWNFSSHLVAKEKRILDGKLLTRTKLFKFIHSDMITSCENPFITELSVNFIQQYWSLNVFITFKQKYIKISVWIKYMYKKQENLKFIKKQEYI